MDPYQPQSDHDLLIRLDTQLKIVLSELKDMKEGISMRLTTTESRIDSIEKNAIQANLEPRLAVLESFREIQSKIDIKKYENMVQWWETYTKSWKWILVGISSISLVVGSIVTVMVETSKVIK